jgi:hypothetical protein
MVTPIKVKKVKLSLYFINEAADREDVWRSEGTAPLFLTLALH